MSDTVISIESLMQRALREPGMLSLAAGFTDNAMLPREEVAELVEALLSDSRIGAEALQYGDPQGRADLRRMVAERVRTLDLDQDAEPGPVDPGQVVITNGSQQALDLFVRASCQPGDAVLVESPTYFVFLDLVRALGVEPVPLPAREDRLDVDALPGFLEDLRDRGDLERVRAAYLMGYFANPTGYSLGRGAKAGFLAALEEADLEIPVLEDAAYREFHFDDAPATPSFLSLESPSVPVLYTATFTKTFATGLKIGYLVVRRPEILSRIRSLKRVSDFGTGNFAQAVVARAVEEGVYDRFLDRMHGFYAGKAGVFGRALEREGLSELGWQWESPRGGLFYWLAAPEGVGVGPGSAFFRACTEEKVMYVPGSLCHADGGEGKIRLSFGNLDEEELEEAAARFGRAARRVAGVAAGERSSA